MESFLFIIGEEMGVVVADALREFVLDLAGLCIQTRLYVKLPKQSNPHVV
jgi:hypothetical protein